MTSKLHICFGVLIVQFIACHACHKGYRWEYNKGAPTCVKCNPGTFMPEDNHNKTECYPCRELIDADTEVLIRECSTEANAVIICKKCGDGCDNLNKTSNITDQNRTAPSVSAVYEINILLILGIFILILLMIGLLLVRRMIGRSELLISLMDYLSNKQHLIDICMFIVLLALVVCFLVTLIVLNVYPMDWIFILMKFVTAVWGVALLAVAILNMLLRQHFSWKARQEYAPPLLN